MLDSPDYSMQQQSSSSTARSSVEEEWRMPWVEMEVILGIRNPLTLRTLNITSEERATQFLKNAGFNLAKTSEQKVFEQFYSEAIFFIRHVLLSAEERQRFPVPQSLLHLENPQNLLTIASDRNPRHRYQRLWACAIFKVFTAIANLEYSDKLRDIHLARDQIFTRIRNLLVQKNETYFFKYQNQILKLYAVDWKEAKTRNSIILKLLHKPESVSDEVFDYLGIRFVVEEEADIPLLLKFLIESDIIIPHQVLTMRTRNTLLHIHKAKKLLDILAGLSSTDRITPQEYQKLARKIPWTFQPTDDIPKPKNAFSSQYYRSLQITVRHLVRIPNPAFSIIDSLAQQVRHYRGIEQEDPSLQWIIPPEIARYFPLEIQIMDAQAYEAARFGPASHEQYKAAQLEAVRERVLSGMLNFTAEKIATQEI